MNDFTVVIGTYGEDHWIEQAQRAAASVPDGVPTIHFHSDTLHDARNAGLSAVETEFVIHLDADDELEEGYVDAMAAATGDMRVPVVRYVAAHGRLYRPRRVAVAGHQELTDANGDWHQCTGECLRAGNWMVIGTAVRAQTLRDVGGWRDFPWSEDWDAWIRVWQTGATIELVDNAVYRAHMRDDSRNRAASNKLKHATHNAIYEANFGGQT